MNLLFLVPNLLFIHIYLFNIHAEKDPSLKTQAKYPNLPVIVPNLVIAIHIAKRSWSVKITAK